MGRLGGIIKWDSPSVAIEYLKITVNDGAINKI